ncbi:hypothetical protein [Sphingomonas trueperi]|uniref:Uncharacterized protein n=1 Tax=Sphingomonas trueperi TaxID=53317 RepID=A0A7X5Y2G6_9SPHN|nr:hypothetical protein [Sphingomonas trueperi]NJB99894.1 hypothetical protein [Sphingomonas trueperi]
MNLAILVIAYLIAGCCCALTRLDDIEADMVGCDPLWPVLKWVATWPAWVRK